VKVRVTLRKSPIGSQRVHRETLRTLGLRRIGQSRVWEDSPSLRGMVRRVAHLVTVEEETSSGGEGESGEPVGSSASAG
jgi:large subunit ribosomal protein L30